MSKNLSEFFFNKPSKTFSFNKSLKYMGWMLLYKALKLNIIASIGLIIVYLKGAFHQSSVIEMFVVKSNIAYYNFILSKCFIIFKPEFHLWFRWEARCYHPSNYQYKRRFGHKKWAEWSLLELLFLGTFTLFVTKTRYSILKAF